ncbi:MAG: acyl-CoA dehydrogenase family protein [Candidatus Aureabacteria bacterium]|nr:acyl-CoA dehydrogenase family protein [Candidatus Auribacterota bacterium]
MDNFYKDNDDIQFQFKHLDLNRVIELKENNFSDRDLFPYAPKDVSDAKDSYEKVLEMMGELSGDFIAPRSKDVDEEGAHFENGEVRYAKGTQEAMEMLAKADVMGFTLPRKYGGLNLPVIVYVIAIELVSRADASLMNLFGLQDIADTINKFASEELKEKYLPRFSSGEVTGSMALTEPDAGSDLQNVALKATLKEDGKWYLNGVKRFITNGCAQVSVVLARSEENLKGGRGLSLFVYERDRHMKIRRIENKLGIHGSPTCELQFTNAPCELIGERKRGLSKYTMSLMNGARAAIAAQALGIAEAAYREAKKYARERVQFGKPIMDMIQVYDMLCQMQIAIEAGRTLLYETAKIVDMKEGLEKQEEAHPEDKALRDEAKRYSKYASLLTPIAKAYNTEMGNQVCYLAIQIHGGTGFMREFNVERHFRDIRITNIYEGTTQLQIVAAIGGIMSGTAFDLLKEYDSLDYSYRQDLYQKIQKARIWLEKSIQQVKTAENSSMQEYHSRRLTEMCTDIIQAYLMLKDAAHSERKKHTAEVFIEGMMPRMEASMNFILHGGESLIKNHVAILNDQN